MSKIKKFQFKNIRSYGNKMMEIPFDMDNGLVLISGKNGGGKTSIVEALEFSIYGKSSRVPVKDLPNWINDNAFTSVEFETDDKRIVQLSRGISPDFYDLKVGGQAYSSKVKNENRAGKNKIDKMVEDELFGLSQDIFANNVLLSVQDFKSFIKMKTADKRKIIDKIFDTDIFNDMLVKVKEELSELKARRTELSAAIESKKNTLDVTNARIDEIKSTISDDIDSVISRYQNNIMEIEGEIKEKISVLETNQKSLDTIQSQYNTIMQEYNKAMYDAMVEYNEAISAIDQEYRVNVSKFMDTSNQSVKAELDKIESERSEESSKIENPASSIAAKTAEAEQRLENIKKLVEDFRAQNSEKMNADLKSVETRINSEVQEYENRFNSEVSSLQNSVSELNGKIAANESEINSNNLQISGLREKLAVIVNKMKLYENDKCPECGADLHDEYHTNELESMKSEMGLITEQINELNSNTERFMSEIQVWKDELENNRNGIGKLQSDYSSFKAEKQSELTVESNNIRNQYNMSLSSLESQAMSKQAQVNSELKAFSDNAKSEYEVKLAEINNRYDEKVNKVREQNTEAYKMFETAQKNGVEIKKSERTKAYDELVDDMKKKNAESVETYISQIEILKSDVKSGSEEIEVLRGKVNEIKINLVTVQNGDSTKTITELQTISTSLQNEIDSMAPELEDVEYKITIRENTQALIGENGLKRMIMRNILPQFNASIQRITSMFDFKYRFVFDDNFDAHLSYCGKEVPITVSRGEEKIMDIIVILSTLQLILMKHPNINMLFLDEIFSNLDVENIAKAVSILKDYSMKYNLMVFVMSHTTVPVELFDKTVNVFFDGTFSTLEIN